MQNLLFRFLKFMQGRYGTDQLNHGLFILWLILNITNTIFIKSIWVSISITLLILIVLFRSLSRNIPQRQKENTNYLYYLGKVKPLFAKLKPITTKISSWLKLQFRKIKDIKTHRYVKCPYCKANIRVPFKKGRHTINCPRCTVDFKKNIKL